MFVIIYPGELPIGRHAISINPKQFFKSHGCIYSYILPCKHQNIHDEDNGTAMQSVSYGYVVCAMKQSKLN